MTFHSLSDTRPWPRPWQPAGRCWRWGRPPPCCTGPPGSRSHPSPRTSPGSRTACWHSQSAEARSEMSHVITLCLWRIRMSRDVFLGVSGHSPGTSAPPPRHCTAWAGPARRSGSCSRRSTWSATRRCWGRSRGSRWRWGPVERRPPPSSSGGWRTRSTLFFYDKNCNTSSNLVTYNVFLVPYSMLLDSSGSDIIIWNFQEIESFLTTASFNDGEIWRKLWCASLLM